MGTEDRLRLAVGDGRFGSVLRPQFDLETAVRTVFEREGKSPLFEAVALPPAMLP